MKSWSVTTSDLFRWLCPARRIHLMVALVCGGAAGLAGEPATQVDPASEWETQPGFEIQVDAAGFQMPTCIRFVPNPGNHPKLPLYFVTELRGKIKVVTNDRTVHTFADLNEMSFGFTPSGELPNGQGESGVGGLCLDPKTGYIFVTFVHHDTNGVMRNNMIRFETLPDRFAVKPTSWVAFTDVFHPYPTGVAHQIGQPLIYNNHLYVGVGDGWQPYRAQNLDTTEGKILRMTLDGDPVSDNPFRESNSRNEAINYVWAYGLRNPFSLAVAHSRMFTADNGLVQDRFVEIRRGGNYLWNGVAASISANAEFVWNPSIGPVQVRYCPPEHPAFPPSHTDSFYIASTGQTNPDGGMKNPSGIYQLQYDFDSSRLTAVPRHFIRYKGDEWKLVTGVAMGPDGLYFTPMYYGPRESEVLKVVYRPEANTAIPVMMETTDARAIMLEKGCLGCHTLDNEWGFGGGQVGPPLTRGKELINRIHERLTSSDYIATVKSLPDASAADETFSYTRARQEVLNAEGPEKVETWLRYFLLEPGFDSPTLPRMPDLNLTTEQAENLAAFLMGDTEPVTARSLVRKLFPQPPLKRRHLAAYFVAGAIFSGIGVLVLGWFRRKLSTAGGARTI